MGRTLLLIVTAITMIFANMSLFLNKHRLEWSSKMYRYFDYASARNCATSGVSLALSKMSFDSSWVAGFSDLELEGGTCDIVVYDETTDSSLTSMERVIVSTGSFQNITKSVIAHVGDPPDLSNLTAYTTGPITNVTIWDEMDNPDPTLAIDSAPFMPPFDFEGLEALAQVQGHVIHGDFSPAHNYPNGSFYYNGWNPNATQVNGDMAVAGGRDVYGIYLVYGDVTLQGGAKVNGVITLPNPGTMVLYEGGSPNDASIIGGVLINGSMNGTGNHIHVKYDSEFMTEFAEFQLIKNLFVLKWLESPSI